MDNVSLKKTVADFWNQQACGTEFSEREKFSLDYFKEIEQAKYERLPEIHSFAQFTRYRGQKVLEVGIGVGIDFLQWVRGGARAYGVDLTQESVDHARQLMDVYGMQAEEIRTSDAENLPYEDDFFDLVYSNGVIHHTPDMPKALGEIIRVTKPGGTIKVTIYNRRSLESFYGYLRYGLLKGKPFRSFTDVIYHHMESLGTQAYTAREVRELLAQHPIEHVRIYAPVSYYDLLPWNKSPVIRGLAYLLACIVGWNKCGWLMNIEAVKSESRIERSWLCA